MEQEGSSAPAVRRSAGQAAGSLTTEFLCPQDRPPPSILAASENFPHWRPDAQQTLKLHGNAQTSRWSRASHLLSASWALFVKLGNRPAVIFIPGRARAPASFFCRPLFRGWRREEPQPPLPPLPSAGSAVSVCQLNDLKGQMGLFVQIRAQRQTHKTAQFRTIAHKPAQAGQPPAPSPGERSSPALSCNL